VTGTEARSGEKYVWKEIPGSSHDLLRRRILSLPPGLRLLDLGAAGGHLGRAVRSRCSYLAGVEPDSTLPPWAREGYDDWREVDALHAGEWDQPFDVVVCADVLEHLANPAGMLARSSPESVEHARQVLGPEAFPGILDAQASRRSVGSG